MPPVSMMKLHSYECQKLLLAQNLGMRLPELSPDDVFVDNNWDHSLPEYNTSI